MSGIKMSSLGVRVVSGTGHCVVTYIVLHLLSLECSLLHLGWGLEEAFGTVADNTMYAMQANKSRAPHSC